MTHVLQSLIEGDRADGAVILLTVEYQDAFPDLADVYLEDSWVLDIAPIDNGVAFRLDAVLTPNHSDFRLPAPDEQYCYRRASLAVTKCQANIAATFRRPRGDRLI